ncbi:MAG TPA: phosphopantetheine-binding protein [Aeromicrobium sp.]|nr:phosphopantetheine-binding protein [Aeromicrobium sp.]
MPTPDEIRPKLAELLGRLADVPRESVRDTALLEELGIDSVAMVELAVGVADSFNVRLEDESVNEWRTVGDVLRTVQRSSAPSVVDDNAGFLASLPPPQLTDPERIGAFKQLAVVFALIGAAFGVIIGVAAAIVLASAIPGGTLPPISAPLGPTPLPSGPSPSATSPFGNQRENEPRTRPTTSVSASLTATPGIVRAGQRFSLAGRLPNARPGESLLVEWRDSGGAWAPFPISVTAGDDGAFASQVYISSPGEREFRVRSQAAGGSTPPTMVRIS